MKLSYFKPEMPIKASEAFVLEHDPTNQHSYEKVIFSIPYLDCLLRCIRVGMPERKYQQESNANTGKNGREG